MGLEFYFFYSFFFALKESAPHLKRQKFSHKETLKSYRFVLKDKPFILYVSCASLVLAAMFAYITGSSFVFINFFGLSERDFGLLFGLNALGFVIFANINAKMVRKIDSEKILFYALIIMLISTLILFVNSLIKPNFWLFELSIFTSIALLGFIAPNTTTLAMARFKDHSGTASAVLGTSQFALAGVISFIVSAVGANTPVILALIMLICVVLANGVYFAMKK